MSKKIIIVRQSDLKDCGPCCLESIISYYGGNVSIEKIREDCYTGLQGTSVFHLIKASENYGFDAVAKKYNDSNVHKMILPAIVHVHLKNGVDHYMCLYEIKGDNFIIMDPASGKIKMHRNVFLQIFSGVAIELQPNSKIVYYEKSNTIKDLVINIIKDNRKIIFYLFLSSIVFTILTIVTSFYFKTLYELIINNYDKNVLKYVVYLFSIIILFKILFIHFKNYYENILTKNIDVRLIGDFLTHVYNLPLKVLNTRQTGEIVSRINELQSIKDLFTSMFASFVVNILLIVTSIIVMLFISKKLMLILLLIMFFYFVFSITINSYLFKSIRNNIDLNTKFNSSTIEYFDMINSLKHLNQLSFALSKSEENLSNYLYDNYKLKSFVNVLNCIYDGIQEIGIFLINTIGFYLVYKNTLDISELILFNNVMVYFINPVKECISYYPKYNFFKASFKKVCEFIDIEEEQLGKKEIFLNGDINIKGLTFSYNGYENSINKVNLIIKQGEKTMIKGKSGSGKSTICKLIDRIYNPDSGEITINNKNILDYNINTIRSHIVYVSQKENLYTDTIKNNILLNRKSKNFDRVCKICLIDDVIDKRKFRYDYGIDNTNLSGGEKQRVILARALLNNFDILILDEALSELDMQKEKKIINNIIKYYPNKTLIYVSHKNQEQLFDRTIIMEEINNA